MNPAQNIRLVCFTSRERVSSHFAQCPMRSVIDPLRLMTHCRWLRLWGVPLKIGLATLEAKNGCLPTAPMVLTGGDGLHIYFRAPMPWRFVTARVDSAQASIFAAMAAT